MKLLDKDIYLITVYLSFFICAMFFSVLINGLLLKFSRSLGVKNSEDSLVRWSKEVKPAIGGISFFIIFLISTIAYPFFFESSQYFMNLNFIGILLSSTLAFLMGLYDDAFDTDPFIKSFTQVTCGLILISTGTYINIFPYAILNYLITLFWIVGMMNSINMLDNMDAITSLVSIFIILTILVSQFLNFNFYNPEIIPLIGIFASIIGFLYYNWHPSKIYMGDTGSQFLGVYLAALGITYFWNGKCEFGTPNTFRHILSALLIFAIPIIDTTTVFLKRMLSGHSPFIGGRDHTTHHISYLGLNDRQVAYIFIGISIVSMILGIYMLNFVRSWNLVYSIIFSSYILVLFLVLYYIANQNKQPYKK